MPEHSDPAGCGGDLQSFLGIASTTILLLAAVVSEHRQAEEAMENSATTVYSQDRDLRYPWIYDGKRRFPPAQVLGKTDAELVPAEDAEPLAQIKRRVLTTGVGERQEVRATTQGATSFYDLAVEPMRDDTGQIVGISGTATDITEIKHYQSHIEETRLSITPSSTGADRSRSTSPSGRAARR